MHCLAGKACNTKENVQQRQFQPSRLSDFSSHVQTSVLPVSIDVIDLSQLLVLASNEGNLDIKLLPIHQMKCTTSPSVVQNRSKRRADVQRIHVLSQLDVDHTLTICSWHVRNVLTSYQTRWISQTWWIARSHRRLDKYIIITVYNSERRQW